MPGDDAPKIEALYLRTLSRLPTPEEVERWTRFVQTASDAPTPAPVSAKDAEATGAARPACAAWRPGPGRAARGRPRARLRRPPLDAAQLERVRPQPLSQEGPRERHERTIVMGRRSLLRVGASAMFGALVARYLSTDDAFAAASRPDTPTRASCLWLNGGPSHIDTFDPKPGRATGGPFKAIKTRAPGHDAERAPAPARRARERDRARSQHVQQGGQPRARAVLRAHRLRPERDRRSPVAGRLDERAPRRRAGAAPVVREHRGTELRRGISRGAERTVRAAEGGGAARRRRACRRASTGRASSGGSRRSTRWKTRFARGDRRRQGRRAAPGLREGRSPDGDAQARGVRRVGRDPTRRDARTATRTSGAVASSRAGSSSAA